MDAFIVVPSSPVNVVTHEEETAKTGDGDILDEDFDENGEDAELSEDDSEDSESDEGNQDGGEEDEE